MHIIQTPVENPAVHGTVLDIETTGLSKSSSRVFLIGMCTEHTLIQWMSESDDEEEELLAAALPALSHQRLYTYNGERFDLPFLKARALTHGLSLPIYESDDLYAYLFPRRAFFRYPDLKLQTIEAQENLSRPHPLSGAEVARKAAERKKAPIAEALLAHNAADVLATAALLPVYDRWREFLSVHVPVDASLEALTVHADRAIARYLTTTLAMPEAAFTSPFGNIVWKGKSLALELPIHRIPFGDAKRIAAVSPSGTPDFATPPLPVPFLTLHEPAGHVPQAIHALLNDLWPHN